MEPLSLDEAYLDVTMSPCCGGSATLMAREIRAAINAELGLTASAGVAPNKFLAKLASEQRKPDGLFVIRPQEVDEFVRQLPLGKLPGIGRKTADRLESLGLYSCEDARQLGNEELIARFGKLGEMLAGRIWGHDEQPVQAQRVRKTIGVETTLASDVLDEAACWQVLSRLIPELEQRFSASHGKEQLMGRDQAQVCRFPADHRLPARGLPAGAVSRSVARRFAAGTGQTHSATGIGGRPAGGRRSEPTCLDLA